jgi:hypothetical protein
VRGNWARARVSASIPVYVRPYSQGRGPVRVLHVLRAHPVMLGYPEAIGCSRALAGRALCGGASSDGLWRVVGLVGNMPVGPAQVCPGCRGVAL